MKSITLIVIAAGAIAALLLTAVSSGALTQADDLLATTDIRVRDGAQPGEVVISWDAVPPATHYRIGYVNMETDYRRAKASVTGDWLEAFVYVDVDARNFTVSGGRVEYTIPRLAQGVYHAFTVLTSDDFVDTGSGGEVRSSFSWPSPRWDYLTVQDWGGACPTAGGPQPTPTPSPTPTPQPRGDYDADNDGLIEITNLAQLDAIRYDLNGNGESIVPAYARAFPDALDGMGCPSDGCKGYELISDLDFARSEIVNWQPIGGVGRNSFQAGFDGNGHTIANLRVHRPDAEFIGLFGYIGGDRADLRSLRLVNVDITGRKWVGGLAGAAVVGANIHDVFVTGQVSTRAFVDYAVVGGLIGRIQSGSTITDSHADVRVIAQSSSVELEPYAGGLVGSIGPDSTVRNSSAQGGVSGHEYVGGLAGDNAGRIEASHATGNVAAQYLTTNARGGGFVGGLVGLNRSEGIIRDSYATGNVFGEHAAGSLVGKDEGVIINSFGSGAVSRP